MSSVSIEFPLLYKQTPFGLLSDPKIPIEVKTLAGYRTYRFLLDTGADFSVVPRRLAQQVGLAWGTLPEAQMVGVGQGSVETRLGNLPVRLAHIEFTVHCLFVDTRIAFILGRADFLERFALTIDHSQQRIVLTDIA